MQRRLPSYVRWTIAAVAALGLAFAVIGVPLIDSHTSTAEDVGPSAAVEVPVEAAAPGVCDANAKAANFSFTLKESTGKSVKLSDYKGRVVLLDFWATWCGPCKIEIPWFVEFQNKYGNQGFSVLGVLVEDSEDKLKPFADQYKMNYPVLIGIDREDVTNAFGPIWGLPTTFLIGRDGKICKKHAGLISKDLFERTIKALLSS
ncbi:MAG: TlpA family protein disulfide reductase [Acidobacteria bacterium]|nr:TlpA family protein disulfide reductase [Acidobacteriota bacterium]